MGERSLPTPEVHGLNPVVGKIYIEHFYCRLYLKDKNKEAGNGPIKNGLSYLTANKNYDRSLTQSFPSRKSKS